jgi:hypothetical protein
MASSHHSSHKVYFTYINPSSLQLEKQELETLMPPTGHPTASDWESRYNELERQMSFFLETHNKMI